MTISESIELLGKGLYPDIPDTLTLKSIPTATELDMVGGEDFDKVMIETILPHAVEESVNFNNLLEIDYQWLCRCLRILNYGPYYTTNAIFCDDCGQTSYGSYQVNLNTVECKPLPEGFTNEIKIDRDQFISFAGDVVLKLPTIQDIRNAYKDSAFQTADGKVNRDLARMCYMVKSIKGKTNLNPFEVSMFIKNELEPADYVILRGVIRELTDYGLRAGGTTTCPKCGNTSAVFIAMIDDRFFRPTLGDVRKWKHDRGSGENNDVSRSASADV